MSDHPTPEELERLSHGALDRVRARKAFGHLLLGCPACLGSVSAAVPFLANGAVHGSARASSEARRRSAAAHDGGHLPAAFVENALPQPPSVVLEVVRATRALGVLRAGGLQSLATQSDLSPLTACLALLRRARELRHGEPAAVVEVALWAALAAQALEPRSYCTEFVADLQARAWAELGNAFRVADDAAAAEQALAKAAALAQRGTGARALQALLLEFRGSLYGGLRRFTEAYGMFDAARAIRAEAGERQQVGRILITKGLYTLYAKDFERAIELLHEGRALVDEERDPQLILAATHNTARALAEVGRLAEARSLLEQNRDRYELHGGRMDLLKRTWLEGAIAAGLGDFVEAERCFVETRAAFNRLEAPYDFALVSLDLAAVWLRQGRTVAARQLVEAAAAIFKHLGITREALAAVLVLQRAFELEVASVALLEPVASLLRRLARDPAARFEAGEE